MNLPYGQSDFTVNPSPTFSKNVLTTRPLMFEDGWDLTWVALVLEATMYQTIANQQDFENVP